MTNKVTAYIALGSNVGDRIDFLGKARELLQNDGRTKIIKSSKVYETEPWPKDLFLDGHPEEEGGRKWFLNQVLEVETTLAPQELIKTARQIEVELGREKREHWGDREIDLDILLYGKELVDTPELQIPHRHMQDRQFVLVPLVEIAPDLSDPISGHRFSDILKIAKEHDDHKVTLFL